MRFSKFFKWHLYKYEDFLWLKFQLSLTLFTGVIAPNPPKWAQQGLKQKKNSCFFWVKLWTENIQKLNLGIQKVYIEGLIIGYVRISDGSLAQPHGGNLGPFFSFFFLLFSFTRILWFFWDLGLPLFDIPTDAFFAEILVFSKIFGFSAVNGAQKWTKTVTFQCIPWVILQKFDGFF